MPAFMTETLVRSLYKRHLPQVQGQEIVPPLTYGRDYFSGQNLNPGDRIRNQFGFRATEVIARVGAATNVSVLVVGSAFGYGMEALQVRGISNVWGIEPGPWFWDPANDDEWADGMKARTVNDWIGSGTEQTSLNTIGVSGQARFDVIIDEDAAPCHSDSELPVFIAGLEQRLKGNQTARIVHLVTTLYVGSGPGDSSQNWKTLTDWEAVAPRHTWLDLR